WHLSFIISGFAFSLGIMHQDDCELRAPGGGASLPEQELKKLLERIHTRLDESMVGISQLVTDLAPADLVELINGLTLAEAATVISMLPVPRIIELFDQPTMRRRAAILEQIDPARAAEILTGLSADERTDVVQRMAYHERHRILPKLTG